MGVTDKLTGRVKQAAGDLAGVEGRSEMTKEQLADEVTRRS